MTHRNFILGQSPFEVLFKDFFNGNDPFDVATNCKVKYPVDIYEIESGLIIDIAAVGLSQEEIDISVEGDVLRVTYNKKDDLKEDRQFIQRGISRKSFNLGWKIGSHFDLKQIEAVMDKGLLSLSIPYAENAVPQKVNITIK